MALKMYWTQIYTHETTYMYKLIEYHFYMYMQVMCVRLLFFFFEKMRGYYKIYFFDIENTYQKSYINICSHRKSRLSRQSVGSSLVAPLSKKALICIRIHRKNVMSMRIHRSKQLLWACADTYYICIWIRTNK